MKRAMLVTLAVLMLAGCGDPTLDERVAYRDKCEALGGRYWEGYGGLAYELTMNCDLERQESPSV